MSLLKNLVYIFVGCLCFSYPGTAANIFSGKFPNRITTSQPAYTYGSYVNGPVCQPAYETRYPKTSNDVVSIVREAMLKGLTVKAFGARHSATDIICTEGIPLNMKFFQKKVMNPDGSATFGAGVDAYDLVSFLKENSRGLVALPAYGNITIGGAIGTGAHGSTLNYHSSFSEQVKSVKIVDGLGIIRTIDSEYSLRAFKVHLGLLGIILEVTLNTVPFYKIRAHNFAISDDILHDGRLETLVRATDQISMWWFPFQKKLVVSNWTNVDASTPGSAYTNYIVQARLPTDTLATANTVEYLQTLPPEQGAALINASQSGNASTSYRGLIGDPTIPRYAPIYTEDGVTALNPAVGDWFMLMSNTCPSEGPLRCTFEGAVKTIDTEFTVGIDEFPSVVARIEDILSKTPAAFPDNGMILRFSKATETYMSESYAKDVVHVEFITIKRQNEYEDPRAWLPAYQTMAQSLAMEFRGRSHWGKSGLYYHSREMINRKLSTYAQTKFVLEMNRYDPLGIFMNKFGRRLRGYGTDQDFDPQTVHCALQDNCICQKDTDCASSQTCGTLLGYNYNVCLFS